jgi:integrase
MASTEKRGDRWLVRWRDDAGKSRAKTFMLKRDADRFRAETEHSLARGTYTDPRAGRLTLAEYGAGWLAASTADASTQEAVAGRWRVHIEPTLGGAALGQLAQRPSTIQSWAAGLLRDGLAPSYARAITKTLSACLNAAVADHLIPANPVRDVSLPRAPQRRVVPWTAGQVTAVREALPGHYRATVDIGAGLGLRQGECFAVAIEDIKFMRPARDGGPVVHVRRQVRLIGGKPVFAPPKGGRERDVPLPGSVALRLSAHIKRYPAVPVTLPWREPGNKPVTARLIFTSQRGGPVNKNSFNHAWRDALDTAGISRGRENGYHASRHHFASLLLHDGVDIRALSEYLGHHSPGFTLATYTHLMPSAPDRMRAAVDAALDGEQESKEAAR